MPTLSISVNIADRPYRLTIDAGEEEVVRKAVKSINENIKVYADTYAYKDKQDLLAMVALQFSTYAVNYEESSVQYDDKVIGKLAELDSILNNCLK